ncbi:NDP-hexose 2,3-dehydratase [Prauserella sp. Am3]|nr:NDP-hexose 2,3-dehydratase [Prauserella sp. Am3]
MVAPSRMSTARALRSGVDARVTASLLARKGRFGGVDDAHGWLADAARGRRMETTRVPIDELAGWRRDESNGYLRHETGRFFSVESVAVEVRGSGAASDAAESSGVTRWCQPIINQPEIGILGILVREIDGVLHFLMQAKSEPGNPGAAVQLSPTVQATRSNYTGVHKGRSIPYLDHFRDPVSGALVDIRQSEQGAWFYRKRNRNMVVEVGDEVDVLDGFRWLTLGQIAALLAVPDLVNMDTRTVLACLPGGGTALSGALSSASAGGFRDALGRSADPGAPAVHTTEEVLSWITAARTRTELSVEACPLHGLPGWQEHDGVISHHSGRFFSVVGAHVRAEGREVACWSQPMIEPAGTGVIAFVLKRIQGVLHVLVHARSEPGYADVVELGPTVQCDPGNYAGLPASARPRYLDTVLSARDVRFDTVLSEEGGRFLGARNRYLAVEADVEPAADDPDYRWLTLAQLDELLRHSFYVNIQARTLVLCLRAAAVG